MPERVRHGIVATLVCLLTLTACTGDADSREFFRKAAVPATDATLAGAVMAFFVGPQNDEMFTPAGEVHEPGYIVLVNADGTFRAVETKRMDMMRPAWSAAGLHFADEDSDYLLSASGMSRTPNPKALAQNLMFTLPAGESVGVYNGGHSDGEGYVNQIGVATSTGARTYPVQGNYFTGARCDDQIFGITNKPGLHARQAPRTPAMTSTVDADLHPQALTRLYPADGGETVVGWRPSFGSGTPIGQVPCHDKTLTFVSWDTDTGGRETPSVVSWNSTDGTFTTRRLTFGDSTQLNFEDFGYVVQDWHDGRLQWVYADGRVFATDPGTGETTALFDTRLGTGPSRPAKSLYAFSGSTLHVLTTTPGGDGNIAYATFDRATGKPVSAVAVAIPNTEINISYRNVSQIAVPPAG